MNSRYIDAEPTRQHILALLAGGLTITRISTHAGLPHRDIEQFIKGDRFRGRQRRISPARAAQILSVDPAVVTPALVDGTGTRRRIEALAAAGWPLERLAEHFGMSLKYISELRRQEMVRDVTAQAVADAYDRLKTKHPENHGVIPPIVKRTRRMASARRWAPPRYWAQRPGVIDDPHFTPEYGRTKADLLAEEATFLVTVAGLTRTQAAIRLGKDKSYVDRVLGPTDMRKAA